MRPWTKEAPGKVRLAVVGTLDVSASLKRIAWAYGCSAKGSEVEREIGDILIAKVASMLPERKL